MYLNKLTLNLRGREARRDLGDVYEMHRTLARAYAADEQSAPARFLWRLEVSANPCSAPVVLLQSGFPANWAFLETLKNYAQHPVKSKHIPLDSWLQEGNRYRFRLLANPTVARQEKRFGLVGAPEQLAWIERQGRRNGFVIESVCVNKSDVLISRKENHRVYVRRACFEGILCAISVEELIIALRKGIGPAKAFGCGLLSIAPA